MVWSAEKLEALMPDTSHLYSDEPEMESSLHYAQLALLVACLEWLWRDRTDFFIGANLTIYFSRQQLKTRDFRGPDFFLVKQTDRRPRSSWVTWEEDGRYPDLIIELLSDTTASVDRTTKKDLYQNRLRTPEYFWYSPTTDEFEGFRLAGHQYEAIAPTPQGWRWSDALGLYLGVEANQLRYFTIAGEKVPTPAEAAAQQIQATQAATQAATIATQAAAEAIDLLEQERQAKLLAQQRAEALAERLRTLGVDVE